MKKNLRRYMFCEYDDLKRVKFKKIERVCDKLFVFIREEAKVVPVGLVQKMQRFGRNAKWIVIEEAGNDGGLQNIMSYVMGELNKRIDVSIEFAVLSDNPTFDPLMIYINERSGRKAVRVNVVPDDSQQADRTEEEEAAHARSPYTIINEMDADEDNTDAEREIARPRSAPAPRSLTDESDDFDDDDSEGLYRTDNSVTVINGISLDYATKQKVHNTADLTVERLERSGNRPALVSTLKNYILLHNEEVTAAGNIDAVIERMEENGKISVKGEEVRYNF